MSSSVQQRNFADFAEKLEYIEGVEAARKLPPTIFSLFYKDSIECIEGYFVVYDEITVGTIELETDPVFIDEQQTGKRVTSIEIDKEYQKRGYGLAAHLLVCKGLERNEDMFSDVILSKGSRKIWRRLVCYGLAEEYRTGEDMQIEEDLFTGIEFRTQLWK